VKGLGRRDGVRPDVTTASKAVSWGVDMEGLGLRIKSEEMTVELSEKRTKQLLEITSQEGEWGRDRTTATALEVRSMVGRLGAMNFIVRSGKYFTWHMLHLVGLDEKDKAGRWKKRQVVNLTAQFHHDLDLWRWIVGRRVLLYLPVAAPCFLHAVRPWKIRWFSDASFIAIGGCCPELGVWWRWDLTEDVKSRLLNRSTGRDMNSIFINQLELLAMVITAYVVCIIENHTSDPKLACPVLMVGDNMTAVHWVNKGRADEVRAAEMMRWIGVIEVLSGWCFSARHIAGKQNCMADGITRVGWEDIDDLLHSLSHTTTYWKQVQLDQLAHSLITSTLARTSQLRQLETALSTLTGVLSRSGATL
jgi:hypothetical protein